MSTLIDSMVAVGILSTGAALLITQQHHSEAANHRAHAMESVARVLDQEMETLRACPDRACVEKLTGRPNEEQSADSLSWLRADIERTLEDGPNGTLKVTLSTHVPGSRVDRKLTALLWVPK